MTTDYVCAECSGKMHRANGAWYHDDASEGADCANVRGDRKLVALERAYPVATKFREV